MSQEGMGVLIHQLFGSGEPSKAVSASLGKVISKIELLDSESGGREDGALVISLADGSKLSLYDDGRSCCESRYMTCEDDLEHYAGATLMGVTLAPGPDEEDEYGGAHEVQFLKVQTDRGYLTVSTHNEHNGYYGGFAVVAQIEEGDS